jgi:hypothetical protein
MSDKEPETIESVFALVISSVSDDGLKNVF